MCFQTLNKEALMIYCFSHLRLSSNPLPRQSNIQQELLP